MIYRTFKNQYFGYVCSSPFGKVNKGLLSIATRTKSYKEKGNANDLKRFLMFILMMIFYGYYY